MTYTALRRGVAALVAGLLIVVSAPALGHAQTTGDTSPTGQTMGQNSGQVATDNNEDDGMDLGWLGLLGLAGLLGLRRRDNHEVHRVDTRTTRP